MFGLVDSFLVWVLAVAGVRAAASSQEPLILLPPHTPPAANLEPLPEAARPLEFELRHVYHRGTHKFPNLHRYADISSGADFVVEVEDGTTTLGPNSLRADVVSLNMQRLTRRKRSDIDSLLEHAEIHGRSAILPSDAWAMEEITGPNTTDKSTVISLAWMTANAYVPEPWKGDWKDVKGGFNYSESFGWEMDGLRGHIFVDKTNSTVVIGLKGTSMAIFDGAETTGHDKTHDNLFGSCCGGQGGSLAWKQVCDCLSSTYTCNSTCLVQCFLKKERYYSAARDLYHNVTERYPNSDVWLSGHSLGGVVSAMLGLTYGIPVMTFEAYPDALAASRLGLPVPPGYKIGSHQLRTDLGIYHYGHTADTVYMGLCNGAFSPCSIAGYAMESRCHTGQTCEYNTVEDLGWHPSVNNHRILTVIPEVLEKYDHVPKCRPNPDCPDCDKWKFFESNGTEKTTTARSSTSTRTRTRTETCQTPGWFGCLDESTTASHTSTTSTSSTTSTCKTPGWFGCLDPTTTVTTHTASPSITTTLPHPTYPPSSTTCKTPGWFGFGCEDEIPSTLSSTHPTTSHPSHFPTRTSNSHTTSTCTSKEFFGLICVDPSPTITTSAKRTGESRTSGVSSSGTSSMTTTTTRHTPGRKGKVCKEVNWFGFCRKWGSEEPETVSS